MMEQTLQMLGNPPGPFLSLRAQSQAGCKIYFVFVSNTLYVYYRKLGKYNQKKE